MTAPGLVRLRPGMMRLDRLKNWFRRSAAAWLFSCRQRGRSQPWLGMRVLDLSMDVADLVFELRDLRFQRTGSIGDGIGFFLKQSHAETALMPQQKGNHAKADKQTDENGPGQRQAGQAKAPEIFPRPKFPA